MRKLLLSVLVALISIAVADAASVIELTPTEIVSGANLIVVARATGRRIETDSANVWTITDFQVTEVLKGSAGANISVKQYGGVVGDMGYAASGIAGLRVGETYLLFLEDTRSITPIRGLFQGLFQIQGSEIRDAFGRTIYWRGADVPLRRGEGQMAESVSSLSAPSVSTSGSSPSPETFQSFRSNVLTLLRTPVLQQGSALNTLALPPISEFDGIPVGDFTLLECGPGSGNTIKGWQNKQYAIESLASINNTGPPSQQWLTAVTAAVADWNSVSPSFQIGLTVTQATAESITDGKNTVGFFPALRGGAAWSTGTLGVTYSAYSLSTCFIVDADVFLNSNVAWATDGTPAGYDVQSVTGHELGHGFGLNHPNGLTNNAIMLTGVLFPGRTIRVQQSDRNAVLYLYAGAAPPPPTGQADLTVTSFRVSTTASVGGPFTISEAIVRNAGAAPAGEFFLSVYLSTDATITPSDIFVAACDIPGLAAGTSANCPGSTFIPATVTPGTYYVGIVADDLDEVMESNEANNIRVADTGPMTISPAVGPDLVVRSVRAGNSAVRGGPLAVTELQVQNQGTSDIAGTFRVGLYFSTNTIITTTTDTFSGFSCTFSQGLAVGATVSCNGTVTVPAILAAGTYFLGAIVDDLNQVSEAIEINNTRVADTGTVVITATAVPDLVVDSLRAGTSATPGGTLAVSELIVRNGGAADATAFRVGVYFSTNNTITSATDTFSGFSCTFNQGLAMGMTASCNGTITVPASLAAGTYFLGAIVDDQLQVAESLESNNTRVADTGTVALAAGALPDLTVISLRASSIAKIGDRLAVNEAIVQNNGPGSASAFRMAFYFSTDSTISASDVFSGSVCTYTTGLAPGTRTCAGEILVPASLSPGTYFLGAIADDLGQVTEQSESNNARAADTGAVALNNDPAPRIGFGGIVNGASFQGSGIAPGSIASLFGVRLSAGLSGLVQASTLPLPPDLMGTSVTVNGVTAPLFAVNAGATEQINFQVPWEVSNATQATVVVRNGSGFTSPPMQVTILPKRPGLFTVDGTIGAILHGLTNEPVTTSNPAVPGEIIVLYATGLGTVNNPPLTGNPAAGSSTTPETPVVTIGGLNAEVRFSGLAPDFVGLYQINVVIPPNVTPGLIDVILRSGGQISNTAKVSVR